MPEEAKAKIECEAYADYRTEAVKRLTMMGVPNVKDDLESMMDAALLRSKRAFSRCACRAR